jgi:hypothetical protein
LIAQALLRTKRIRLGPLGHLLPYHHPVELAHRVAYLDHMAEGRYQLGVGISALPTDHALFGLGVSDGRMTFEAIAPPTNPPDRRPGSRDDSELGDLCSWRHCTPAARLAK